MGGTPVARASEATINARITLAKERKGYFENYLNKLNRAYARGEVNHSFYIEAVYRRREGRNIFEWIDFYNRVIKDCEDLLKKQKRDAAKKIIPLIFFAIIIAIFVIFPIFQLKSIFTGFAVQQNASEVSVNTSVNVTTNNTGVNVTTNSTGINVTTNITQQQTQGVSADPGVNVTTNITQQQAVLGQPVKWTEIISLDKPSHLSLKLPREARNINVKGTILPYSGKNPEEYSSKSNESLPRQSLLRCLKQIIQHRET